MQKKIKNPPWDANQEAGLVQMKVIKLAIAVIFIIHLNANLSRNEMNKSQGALYYVY
jgi:hypothetical protein